MIITIENLAYHQQYIETVIDWLYSEWGNNNKKYWSSWVKSSLSLADVPQTFVTFVNGEIAGTYSLWRCDLQSRQDLFPWFGGLFVAEKFRGKEFNGQKLGIYMQKHAINQLRILKYKKMYLFTERKTKYYIENGWAEIGCAVDERDKIVSICEYSIEE